MPDAKGKMLHNLHLYAFFLKYTFKIVLFGIGVQRGNPYRVIYGTDVAGNICGKKNDKISGIKESGQDLEDYK